MFVDDEGKQAWLGMLSSPASEEGDKLRSLKNGEGVALEQRGISLARRTAGNHKSGEMPVE